MPELIPIQRTALDRNSKPGQYGINYCALDKQKHIQMTEQAFRLKQGTWLIVFYSVWTVYWDSDRSHSTSFLVLLVKSSTPVLTTVWISEQIWIQWTHCSVHIMHTTYPASLQARPCCSKESEAGLKCILAKVYTAKLRANLTFTLHTGNSTTRKWSWHFGAAHEQACKPKST